ncbi:MAG TPA: fibronectin type III domain-containing protein, partial [Steroidobacteraceae bacterium]
TVSLPAFSISVTQIGTGSATVSWVPPTENEDGSALTDLARYRVLYGRTSSNLDQSLVVNNAGASTASIDNLSPGTWFFGVVAINSVGTESALSNIASKTI